MSTEDTVWFVFFRSLGYVTLGICGAGVITRSDFIGVIGAFVLGHICICTSDLIKSGQWPKTRE
jgi:hypothetical protein